MSNAQMKELEALVKLYMEKELPRQMEEAWATGDYVASSNLSKANQAAYNLLCAINVL